MNRSNLLVEKLTHTVYSTLLLEASILSKQAFLELKKGTILTPSDTPGSVEYKVVTVTEREDKNTKVGYVSVIELSKPGSEKLPDHKKEGLKTLSFEQVKEKKLGIKTIEDKKLESVLDSYILKLFKEQNKITFKDAKQDLLDLINKSKINDQSKKSMLASLEKQRDLNGLYRWAANMLLAKKGLKVK
jgi:hypothetical protein